MHPHLDHHQVNFQVRQKKEQTNENFMEIISIIMAKSIALERKQKKARINKK